MAVSCPPPGVGLLGRWRVEVRQNGVSSEPALLGGLYYEQYDLGALRLDSAVPPGGPVATDTAVTIHGGGFVSYEPGQLVCVGSYFGSTVNVAATLLDATRLVCVIPRTLAVSIASGHPSITLAVSMSQGIAGAPRFDPSRARPHSPTRTRPPRPAPAAPSAPWQAP